MAERIDFEAEGLLGDLEGEELAGRRRLLERLAEEGVGLDELRSAVEEGRLAVLPVEHLLAGEPRYSLEEVAELSGVPAEILMMQRRALGVATSAEDAGAILSGADLDQAHRARALLDAGLSPEETAELGRTIAVSMSQFAAASRQVLGSAFGGDADTEADVSDRIYEQTQGLLPLVGPTLDYVYRLHMREQLRHASLGPEALRGRAGAAAEIVSVAFADLVGYTELGESLPPEELGRVTGRLDELSREVATGPVRLVKLIGDAAMLASLDTEALVGSTFELIEGMATEGDELLLRAGIARGPVLSRGGDYYGSAVNLASRVTDAARPSSVLVTEEVREELDGTYRFSDAGHKHLKGIGGAVKVYRCREIEEDDDEGASGDSDAAEGARGSRGGKRRRARRSGQRRR